MRVISGNLKGKKIYLPNDKKTRPLRDLVKESIFNLIEHSNKFNLIIDNSKVLDLFAGTGSFGIECISRNAKKVTFLENHNEALKVLNQNINLFKIGEKSEVIDTNCFKYLNLVKEKMEKFDLIFVDPPYKEEKINLLIDLIKENKILAEKGLIIIHRHKKDKIVFTNKLLVLDERNYGISKIIIGN